MFAKIDYRASFFSSGRRIDQGRDSSIDEDTVVSSCVKK